MVLSVWAEIPFAEPPDDVVKWRPNANKSGPQKLEEFLAGRKLPLGISVNRDNKGRPTPGMIEWVRQWVVGCIGDVNPLTQELYIPYDAFKQNGLADYKVILKWWRYAQVKPPADMVDWEPTTDGLGPRTLAAYVVQEEKLPAGAPLTRAWLTPGTRNSIRLWVIGRMGRQNPLTKAPYDVSGVVDQSGGLVKTKEVAGLWHQASLRTAVEVPNHLVDWEPLADRTGPRTHEEYLAQREDLPAGISPVRMDNGKLTPETLGLVHRWVMRRFGRKNPLTGTRYTTVTVAQQSGMATLKEAANLWEDHRSAATWESGDGVAAQCGGRHAQEVAGGDGVAVWYFAGQG